MLAITPKDTQGKHWSEPANLLPYTHHSLVPVIGTEVGRLGASMPLAIHDDQLVGVCGFQPDHNLYIDPKGQWLGTTTPQWFSTHPVYLHTLGSTKAIPCIDTSTSLIVDPPAGEPIHDTNNQLNPNIQTRIQHLVQTQPTRQKTQQAVTVLKQADVLIPWPKNIIEQHNISIQGLYTLDERALAKLPDAEYLNLRKHGAIALGYALSYSLNQIHILKRLQRLNGAKPETTEELDLDELFGEKDDLIQF